MRIVDVDSKLEDENLGEQMMVAQLVIEFVKLVADQIELGVVKIDFDQTAEFHALETVITVVVYLDPGGVVAVEFEFLPMLQIRKVVGVMV